MDSGDEVLLRVSTTACLTSGRSTGASTVSSSRSSGGSSTLEARSSSEVRVHPPGRRPCGGRIEKLATRFAAKEATTKVLGTGIRGISLREIEVVTMPSGQPVLRLHDRARQRAAVMGITSLSVSLSHTSAAAEAFVVALTASP